MAFKKGMHMYKGGGTARVYDQNTYNKLLSRGYKPEKFLNSGRSYTDLDEYEKGKNTWLGPVPGTNDWSNLVERSKRDTKRTIQDKNL